MATLRSKQKTPYTPAFVGGVLFFLLSLALVLWFASRVVVWVQDQQKKMAAKLDDPSKVWVLDDLVKRGEKVYAANCVACHQPTGKGAGPIKALDGAAVVLDADKTKQIKILLNGQNNGSMPAWKQLSDTDLAAVISYTKNNWSNKTGQLVQPAEVKAAR